MQSRFWIYAICFVAGVASGSLGARLAQPDAGVGAGAPTTPAGSEVRDAPAPASVRPDPAIMERLARIERRLAALEAGRDMVAPSDPVGEVAPEAVEDADSGRTLPPREAFIEAGILPGRASYLAERFEALQYQNLERRYARQRGDGGDAGPIVDPLAALRPEVSDDEFDRLLLALGRPNRVVVRDVLTTSPAELADIRAGDIIYAYGGERVYSVRDLRRNSFGSEAGATVPVEVLRDGSSLIVYLPGGPLGVSVEPLRLEP